MTHIFDNIRENGQQSQVENLNKNFAKSGLEKGETPEEDILKAIHTVHNAFLDGQIPVGDILKAHKNIQKLTKRRKLITRGGRTFLTTVYVDETGQEQMTDVAHTAYETPESLQNIAHLHHGDMVKVVRKDGSTVTGKVEGLTGLSTGKIQLALKVEGEKWSKYVDPSSVKSVEKVEEKKSFSWDKLPDASLQQLKDKLKDVESDINGAFPEEKDRLLAQTKALKSEIQKRADDINNKMKEAMKPVEEKKITSEDINNFIRKHGEAGTMPSDSELKQMEESSKVLGEGGRVTVSSLKEAIKTSTEAFKGEKKAEPKFKAGQKVSVEQTDGGFKTGTVGEHIEGEMYGVKYDDSVVADRSASQGAYNIKGKSEVVNEKQITPIKETQPTKVETVKEKNTFESERRLDIAERLVRVLKKGGTHNLRVYDRTRRDEKFTNHLGENTIKSLEKEVVVEKGGVLVYKTRLTYETTGGANFSKDNTTERVGKTSNQLATFFESHPEYYNEILGKFKSFYKMYQSGQRDSGGNLTDRHLIQMSQDYGLYKSSSKKFLGDA